MYYGVGILSARGARPDYWTLPAVIAFQGALPIVLEVDSIDLVLVAPRSRRCGAICWPRTSRT